MDKGRRKVGKIKRSGTENEDDDGDDIDDDEEKTKEKWMKEGEKWGR